MEPFVERKMEETKERKLVEWDPEDAKKRLAEVLFEGLGIWITFRHCLGTYTIIISICNFENITRLVAIESNYIISSNSSP